MGKSFELQKVMFFFNLINCYSKLSRQINLSWVWHKALSVGHILMIELYMVIICEIGVSTVICIDNHSYHKKNNERLNWKENFKKKFCAEIVLKHLVNFHK